MVRFYTFISIFIFLSGFQLRGQDESFVSIGIGAAIPQGDFAKTDSIKSGYGYGKLGFLFSLDGAYFPDYYLGIGGSVNFSNFALDVEKYKSDYFQWIRDKYPDLEIPDSTVINYNLGSWTTVNLLIGPHGTFGGEVIHFDIRALGGASFVFHPAKQLQLYNEEQQLNFSRTIGTKAKVGFGWDLGIGLRYSLNSNMVLRLSGDYTGTKVKYELVDEIEDEEGVPVKSTNEISYPVKSIQVTIGIAYKFDI